jgi:hypothetical protein
MSPSLTRRDALFSTSLAFALAQGDVADAAAANSTPEALGYSGIARSATRVHGFADPEMDFQLLRGLGLANYGGGAVGEIFATIRNIKDGDAGLSFLTSGFRPRRRRREPACTQKLSVDFVAARTRKVSGREMFRKEGTI